MTSYRILDAGLEIEQVSYLPDALRIFHMMDPRPDLRLVSRDSAGQVEDISHWPLFDYRPIRVQN